MAKVGASKVKGPSISSRPAFVLGSRPSSLRQKPVQRIKPADASTTAYGKQDDNTPNPAGASFGNTGMTGLS